MSERMCNCVLHIKDSVEENIFLNIMSYVLEDGTVDIHEF